LVVLNAVWLGFEVAYNDPEIANLYDEDAIFIFMENLFCVMFGIELAVRFGAFERKRDCIKD